MTGAALHGLCFDFHYGEDAERDFGPCVQLSGGGVSLSNLLLHNPTEGIMWDGATNIGRLNLESIFVVNARRCGVYVAHTLDVATLRNVEVWNYVPDLVNTCTGFRLGHNDEIRLSNCTVVAAAVGFHFVETKLPDGTTGTTWGGMDNCTVDSSGTGIKVDAAHTLRINGGSIWGHHFGVVVSGRSNVILSGADLRANGSHCLHVQDCDTVTVNGCLFKKNGLYWPDTAKAQLDGGRSIIINGCTFDDTSAGVRIGPGVRRFSIAGNVFADMAYPAITDESTVDAAKVVANNLGAR
jgi:polygalacturonase